jgi:MFS family permease
MFVATIPSVLYIDRVGRKPVLTIGAIGMATCHIIIAAIVATYRDSWDSHKGAGWAAVAMVWYMPPSSRNVIRSKQANKQPGSSSSTSVILGVLALGSLSLRFGHCPIVHMVSHLARRVTG